MASESDPMQQILAQLASLQQTLAQQEARHHDEMMAIRKELEEHRTALQSATEPRPELMEAESSPASKPAPTSRDGSSPSLPIPTPTRTNPEPVPTKSDRLPDPPLFNGKRKDLPAFLRKLRYKLEGNSDRFPSERSRLLYAHSRLDRDVVTLIDSLMDKDISRVDQFVAFLEATYGDPNKEMTALSKMNTLKQGRRSFTAHFAEFRRLASDTGLNEIGLIASLRNSLSLELQRAMVGESLPDNLNVYANLIATYDNNMRFLPAPVSAPYRPRAAPTVRQDPDAMEIDSNYAPAGSKERESRKRKGLCFKCGKHGHISRDCSVPLPQTRLNDASSSRSAPLPNRSRRSSDSSKFSDSSPRRSRRSRSRSKKSSRKGSSRR
jgi:hypothetical protein